MRRALALPFSGLQCGRASSVFSVRYLLLLASLFPSHVFSSSSDGHQRLYQHYQSHLNIKLLNYGLADGATANPVSACSSGGVFR